ncbi:hypothetical protein Prudu_004140 [Prunus dulcis]|uniref:Uncharacterized protein n=1 Tax=Prunus dulcis TaxID=3755 RepID=A0A4Y1QUQ5_PRUDU|nr:hypothetical protein Prudu_004140 [Prunus dulcis]
MDSLYKRHDTRGVNKKRSRRTAGEQSEQEEKLASRLEKGKSHFKGPFNSRVPGHDDFDHHKRGQ